MSDTVKKVTLNAIVEAKCFAIAKIVDTKGQRAGVVQASVHFHYYMYMHYRLFSRTCDTTIAVRYFISDREFTCDIVIFVTDF